MPPDPTKQECHGLYLYGAGYFSRDDNTLSFAIGRGVASARQPPPHFCLTCLRRNSCEAEHERRVREAHPGQVELFDLRMREAERRGFSPTIAKLFLGQQGLDPFATAAIDNFNRGHAERGQHSGLIVHSDVDPRRQ